MTICARRRDPGPGRTFSPISWAVAALAVVAALLAAGCGSDSDETFTSVVVAIRTDGGSPAISAFAGDLESNPIELPPGRYYAKAVNGDGDVFPLDEVVIGPGETLSIAPFSGFPSDQEMTDAVRIMADFLVELEIGRLAALKGMSGGYATPLFDTGAEPEGDELESLLEMMDSLAAREDAVRQALAVIEGEMLARKPVAYVEAGGSPPRQTLEDLLLEAIFFASGNARERSRGRVSDVLARATDAG